MPSVLYERGAVRWRRHADEYDARRFRPAEGWDAFAHLLDTHPITGKQFRTSQWWIQETYVGKGAKK